tara:strand:- start:5574 stop:6188 length:615 start_codon:yes stop_codon:yes gene_type:complete
MKKVYILNYGLGNVYSLFNAIKYKYGNVEFLNFNENFNDVDILFIPGVGSFNQAMKILNKNFKKLLNHLKKNKIKVVGICLGHHLLFQNGTEGGKCKGLGLIKGNIKPLKKIKKTDILPNIGWRNIKLNSTKFPIFKKYNKQKFYFCHSYFSQLKFTNQSIFSTSYCNNNFTCLALNENVFGIQFHPEKSREIGLEIINDIINY